MSPEFELALYTMAFLAGEEENIITLEAKLAVVMLKLWHILRSRLCLSYLVLLIHVGICQG